MRQQEAGRGAPGDGAETKRQGADLLPGAHPLVHGESGSLPAGPHTLTREQCIGGRCPGRKPPAVQEGEGDSIESRDLPRPGRSGDTGAPGTCRSQRITGSQRNLTEDSDSGMCP